MKFYLHLYYPYLIIYVAAKIRYFLQIAVCSYHVPSIETIIFGIPLIVVFLGWFMYESYMLHQDDLGKGLFWGGCIGGIIGAIFGFSLHFKTQRQYQEIIDQIEDLTSE